MMSTCSRKKNLENHTEGRKSIFDEIPQDLVMEIIGRLPAQSVARFLRVSKSWARIISSRHFIRSFPAGSCSSQPRLLVCFIGGPIPMTGRYYYFFSSSSSSTTFLSRVECPFENPKYLRYNSRYANGLIKVGCGTEKLICNPSTGMSITLPRAVRVDSRSFFGYDSVHDQYKILLMTKNLPIGGIQHGEESARYKYQVLTLRAEQPSSWRMIEYSIPHRYCANSHLCIDGVVYFVAKTGADWSQRSLMKFDLRYEKLDLLTSLSEDMPSLRPYSLKNYQGKVAIPTYTSGNTFNVWVIDQAAPKNGWLKKSFCSETWKSLSKLRIYGSTHTGEFVLAPRYYSDDFDVMLWNPNTNGLRKIKIDVTGDYEFKHGCTRALVFPDYVESIRLLSEGQFHLLR